MSAAHTPGPWEAHFNGSITASVDDSRPLLDIAIGMAFAPAEKGRFAFDVQRANARLMACAPELLAALIAVTTTCGQEFMDITPISRAFDQARAAIAKAEGGEK